MKKPQSDYTSWDKTVEDSSTGNDFDDDDIFITLTKYHHRTGKPLYIRHLNL